MDHRIQTHPVLPVDDKPRVGFTWNDRPMIGVAGEMIASALVANGIHTFGHHPKDGSPQGLFCANGQCSQCLVIVNGLPVKGCMTALCDGMQIQSVEGLPKLPLVDAAADTGSVDTVPTDVLIIGGGPAGLSAAIELGRQGVQTLLVDDKDRLGGKLVLQTHKFFGSVKDSHAGTRGFEIGRMLADEVAAADSVRIWLNATAVGVFSDQKIGVVTDGRYRLIQPKILLVATGAREKMIAFPGNTLPGVYGAGAFQTLVNRDLVRSSEQVLIVGGGNVGLIAGYHAIQAGIRVAALIEALPAVGGYKVHADKLARLGVPILTRHTILAAHGKDHVTSATIAALNDQWQVITGTEKTYNVDTVLIAVGLAEVNEFHHKARRFGLETYSAGDAQEIAEASAAIFSGRIEARKVAASLGIDVGPVPSEWLEKVAVLKSRPGETCIRPAKETDAPVYPVFHCTQEVPCNPCTSACPIGAIHTEKDMITGLPYRDDSQECTGCLNCAAICPGLAITLVDGRKDAQQPTVTIPWEIEAAAVEKGQTITVTDTDGVELGRFEVQRVRRKKNFPATLLVQVQMDKSLAHLAAGIQPAAEVIEPELTYTREPVADDAVICRCERVSAGEIRALIRGGIRDMNQLKAVSRAGMGSCGSKTCRTMIWRIFQEEGIDLGEVTDRVDRPLFVEVPMGCFAGIEKGSTHEPL